MSISCLTTAVSCPLFLWIDFRLRFARFPDLRQNNLPFLSFNMTDWCTNASVSDPVCHPWLMLRSRPHYFSQCCQEIMRASCFMQEWTLKSMTSREGEGERRWSIGKGIKGKGKQERYVQECERVEIWKKMERWRTDWGHICEEERTGLRESLKEKGASLG